MATRNLSIATIGWPAIATGIAAILAVIFLILMFTVSISLGTINDVLNSITGLSSGFSHGSYTPNIMCVSRRVLISITARIRRSADGQ